MSDKQVYSDLGDYFTVDTNEFGNITVDLSDITISNNSYGIYNSSNGNVGCSQYNNSWHNTKSNPSLQVDGDIIWKGKNLGKLMEKIESRLAILEDPTPEKLEKFAALKKAYENYKLLERLIGDGDENVNA
jgi:hypothetical protein